MCRLASVMKVWSCNSVEASFMLLKGQECFEYVLHKSVDNMKIVTDVCYKPD